MTASACRAADIDFAGVHDNDFGHMVDGDAQDRIFPEQFGALHERPILDDLVTSFRAMLPDEEFPDPPPRGNFDIREVLSSPYFFS